MYFFSIIFFCSFCNSYSLLCVICICFLISLKENSWKIFENTSKIHFKCLVYLLLVLWCFFFKFMFLFSIFIFSSSFYFICKKKKQNCSWLCAFKNPFIQIVHQQFLSISWKLHITEWKVKYIFFCIIFFWKVIIKYCMMNKKNCLTVYVDMHSINCILIPTCFSIYIFLRHIG